MLSKRTMSKLSPLSRAAIRHGELTVDQLREVAEHGADTGWLGFTSYTDTLAFARKNKRAIMTALIDDVDECGMPGCAAMMVTWKCMAGMNRKEIDQALQLFLIGDVNEDVFTVANALAWYALERAANEVESLKGE